MNPIIVIIKSLLWWLNQPFMPLFFGGGDKSTSKHSNLRGTPTWKKRSGWKPVDFPKAIADVR